MRPLPLSQRGGVLRFAADGKNGIPGVHVRRERDLRGPQLGRAEPLGLEEDQGGDPGSAGEEEVHLRNQEERHGAPLPAAESGTHTVKRVCVCLTKFGYMYE